ncbi:MFS transporter [Actinoplanes sp. L3-i22]|uniref:MFS transporter n=1 Tax=Actinoplanes sp. L3-i22 TaxID=2836373 RepID=UPI001C857B10|nr:MFS transporter [Actinoplanes sp. L3-i22]
MSIDAPARIVTRSLLIRLLSVMGAAIGFYLPLSVVPLFAKQSGSDLAAGLATVALLVATVLGELGTPRLTARLGYRRSLALGLTLLGLPTVILIADASPATILTVSVVRGLGFAICTVAGGALTAESVPADRRGEGLAVVGLVSGMTSIVALPAGVWAAARWGFAPVFAATAVLTLAALASIPALPGRAAPDGTERNSGVLAGLLRRDLRRPAAVFAFSTAAVGVLVTFLPLALIGRPAWVAATALLVQPTAATAARWVAGRLGDRGGAARLLASGLVLAVLGMAALALTGSPAAVVGGALAFGIGFGLLQNTTLTLMYDRAPDQALTVSAIWNSAYDLGMAAGALVAGFLVTAYGYQWVFVLTAASMLPAFALLRGAPR